MEKTYFLESKEQYLEIKASWKNYINNGGRPRATDMMFYNILRSKSVFNGFSPATNINKLSNGHDKWYGTREAKRYLGRIFKYNPPSYWKEIFGDNINEESIKKAWEQLEKENLA